MKLPGWLRWPWNKPDDQPSIVAHHEQQAKLRSLRAQAPEVRRAVNEFVDEVEAALARRRLR